MDLMHVAEVYSVMKKYVPAESLPDVANDVVGLLLDQGYTAAQIEMACEDCDEIYEALDEQTIYTQEGYNDEDEYEEEEDYEEENEMEDLEYYDEE